MEAAAYCTRCGQPAHGACDVGNELDPPRHCPRCGRRLRVQVVPDGFRSECPACDRAGVSGAAAP